MSASVVTPHSSPVYAATPGPLKVEITYGSGPAIYFVWFPSVLLKMELVNTI